MQILCTAIKCTTRKWWRRSNSASTFYRMFNFGYSNLFIHNQIWSLDTDNHAKIWAIKIFIKKVYPIQPWKEWSKSLILTLCPKAKKLMLSRIFRKLTATRVMTAHPLLNSVILCIKYNIWARFWWFTYIARDTFEIKQKL